MDWSRGETKALPLYVSAQSRGGFNHLSIRITPAAGNSVNLPDSQGFCLTCKA
jgi:hypothetical protein